MSENENHEKFPLLELPELVLKKVFSFMTNVYDIKVLRRTCCYIKRLIDRNPEILINLKVTPKELKDLEDLVNLEGRVKWSNFHIPPQLYYVGCRRYYIETFNALFSSFGDHYASNIQILEMDRFHLSNVHHVKLLKNCRKLTSFKVDAMKLNEVAEEQLQDLLDDACLCRVLNGLQYLDINVFEFLIHDYQYEFMGKLLQKCTNLQTLGSWGYFPEWEQPNGGTIHLKYFLWPVIQFMKSRMKDLNLMLKCVEAPKDLLEFQLAFLNDSMDWQSGKWILDLSEKCENNGDDYYSSLERLIYSRIKCYSHRAVGWFDENEFMKSGLALMTNLSTIFIHNARDIKLESNPFEVALFPNLENLTLIVGNRLDRQNENMIVQLEQVIVDMLLNVSRPNVKHLSLDIDLDHHHQNGSFQLSIVIRNFPNLTYFSIHEWGPVDLDMLAIYAAFPKLKVLMFCGRNLTDHGFLGNQEKFPQGIKTLEDLKILKVYSFRLPPKNVFPFPIMENNNITDCSFQHCFSRMGLRQFHFLLKSNSITVRGLKSLLDGPFHSANQEFSMNWLPNGATSADDFQSIHGTFRYLDRNLFSDPGNFVIPDIGKWVL